MKRPLEMEIPHLEEGIIHIWSFTISSAALYAEKLSYTLSQREIEKAERFYHERDRLRSMTVYALLRDILSNYTGMDPEKIQIDQNRYGKPFMNAPKAPSFSLSHSEDKVLFAFTACGDIGADIELEKERRDLKGMINQCCTLKEKEKFSNLSSYESKSLFYRFWTAKEAYVKALGTGLSIPLKSIDLSRGNTIGSWVIQSLDDWPGYSASIAHNLKDPAILSVYDDQQ